MTETDLADTAEAAPADVASRLETAVPDIRDTADRARARTDEGGARVATADEVGAAVERAQRALIEIRARRTAEGARAAEEAAHMEEAHHRRAASARAAAELVAE